MGESFLQEEQEQPEQVEEIHLEKTDRNFGEPSALDTGH